MLKDIIQTQEKLCWNFGRKRKTISMGVYRQAQIKWPVHQTAADPDTTSFVPLQTSEKQTLRQIVENHPKGKEYGWILKDFKKYPLLVDDNREVLSMAPIINSAHLGAVEVGDTDLLVELTGDDMASLMLSANIVACDFYDSGYKILPVKVHHEYDTGFGQDIVTPYYFQDTTSARLSAINKKLGDNLTEQQVIDDLVRMGNDVKSENKDGDVIFTVSPAPYRNDFLHEVDVIEDVMIGQDLDYFKPASPNDFTIGRLLPITQKQILTDDHAKHRIDRVAGLHVVCRLMIRALIFYIQPIQKIISSDLPGETPFLIFWPSAKQLHCQTFLLLPHI